MDLTAPRLYDLRVDEYEVNSNGITIKSATVLNEDGSDNRKADLSKMKPHLKDVNFIFNG